MFAIKKIIKNINNHNYNNSVKEYIRHNKNAFNTIVKSDNKNGVILIEFNELHSAHIAYSYLANTFSKINNSKIVAYHQPIIPTIKNVLAKYIPQLIYPLGVSVYRSFGTLQFITPNLNKEQKARSEELFNNIISKLNSKYDVESISIDNVWLGDLIYDSYLKIMKKPTIEDIKSYKFQKILRYSINLFVYWDDYFSNNNVNAINVSHCVYTLAIPLRIAIKRNIPAFQINLTHLYRLDNDHLFAYSDFKYFKKQFNEFSYEMQNAGVSEAEKRIRRRLSGEVGVDMDYSTKSAYNMPNHHQLLKNNDRYKILIATHCFFDSPHSYGLNLFPDFYEWIDFLGNVSEKTEYDWYIKTHPDYLPGTKEIIDQFINRYNSFNLLPSNSSHHQIIEEGIDVALTVYGTIGFEYAALDIPVINASLNNPHIAFDFNIHPKTVDEYEKILMDLENLHLNIDKKEIYEFYFVKNIYNTENWLFDNYRETIRRIGGYNEQFTTKIYDAWLSEWTAQKHEKIVNSLLRFIKSGDFRLNHKHMCKEFCIQ